jgi:hypothetical protein
MADGAPERRAITDPVPSRLLMAGAWVLGDANSAEVPASISASARMQDETGVWSEGFSTTAFPAARAGAIL